jgi:hypothetical protein
MAVEYGGQQAETCDRQRAARSTRPPVEPPPPAPAPAVVGGFAPRAESWWVSLGLGVGGSAVDDPAAVCATCAFDPFALGASLEFGRMLTRRIGVGLEADLTVLALDAAFSAPGSLGQVSARVSARYALHPRIAVRGSVGLALSSLAYETPMESRQRVGTALASGIVAELFGRRHLVVEGVIAGEAWIYRGFTASAGMFRLQVRLMTAGH